MKSTDRIVLVALPMAALVAAFWFLVLAPKREEASSLEQDVAELQAEVDEQEAIVAAAEAARETFPASYRRVVVLGKAVPEGSDTSSLLVQLTRNAGQTGVDFSSLKLVPGAGAAPPAPAATGPITPATAAKESEQEVASVETATPTEVTPTETSVASLPVGATVGPAGLAVMPYELGFSGEYFGIADFFGRLNSQVALTSEGRPSVFGRLITVDGFSLTVPDDEQAVPGAPSAALDAQFLISTFLTPASEGLTAGATPAGPPPAGPQPVSTAAGTTAPPAASVGGSIPAGGTP
jgi:hypothetical protein